MVISSSLTRAVLRSSSLPWPRLGATCGGSGGSVRWRGLFSGAHLQICTVDAFALGPYSGNQAAVVHLQPDAGHRDIASDCDWMLKVAREMNLSETAFVQRRGTGPEFDLRWFTPTVEVDLCGHATMAAAHALWTELQVVPAGTAIRFHTLSGELGAAQRDGGWVELDFPADPAVPLPPAEDAVARVALAEGLGIDPSAISFTGRNRIDVLAELTPEAFAAIPREPNFSRLRDIECRVLIVTAAEPADSGFEFAQRAFAPRVGVDEDPVCGSAHCALGPFWAAKLKKTQLLGRAASARGGQVLVNYAGAGADGPGRIALAGRPITTLNGRLLHA